MKLRLLFITAVAVIAAAWYGAYLATPNSEVTSKFAVAPAERTDAIIAHLKDAGVIRSTLLFKLALRNSGLAAKLQPGSYDLFGVRTYEEVIRRLATGGSLAHERRIRIIEGWTLREIRAALLAAGYDDAPHLYEITGVPAVDGIAPSAASRDFSSSFDFLADKPTTTGLEGYLFPDTYRFFDNATNEDIVRAMLANFGAKLTPDIRRDINASGRRIFDTVIVASIVEREVMSSADRAKIADIFWRRLGARMPLQADSTVNYVTGNTSASASAEDIAIDSPYNTYKYRGLPPGPISNPGLASLIAAARPESNGYWYFLTDKDGTVHYARTFQEHVRNKRLYLTQ